MKKFKMVGTKSEFEIRQAAEIAFGWSLDDEVVSLDEVTELFDSLDVWGELTDEDGDRWVRVQ